jgi:nucleoside-diphosphate-sugar epimerase
MLEGIVGGAGRVRFGALAAKPDDPPCIVARANRLLNEVGFRPTHTLSSGLEATVRELRRMQISSSA